MELTDCGGEQSRSGLVGGKSVFPGCDRRRLDLLAKKIEVAFIPSSSFSDM